MSSRPSVFTSQVRTFALPFLDSPRPYLLRRSRYASRTGIQVSLLCLQSSFSFLYQIIKNQYADLQTGLHLRSAPPFEPSLTAPLTPPCRSHLESFSELRRLLPHCHLLYSNHTIQCLHALPNPRLSSRREECTDSHNRHDSWLRLREALDVLCRLLVRGLHLSHTIERRSQSG